MQDLTKIEKPFALLDAETKARLKAHDGPIEWVYDNGWLRTDNPQWSPHLTYRAAPAPLTKPTINWDHVNPKWVAMATDEDGSEWLYASKPTRTSGCWIDDYARRAEAFASFVSGTCDWRDSLVMRPGGEA